MDNPEALAGKRVVVVEDGPTLTHGEMKYGAGVVAARRGGAEIVDPRPYATGTLKETYEQYDVGPVLPAMGYSQQQLDEMRHMIDAADCDLVVIATPIDLRSLHRHLEAGGPGHVRARRAARLAEPARRAEAGPGADTPCYASLQLLGPAIAHCPPPGRTPSITNGGASRIVCRGPPWPARRGAQAFAHVAAGRGTRSTPPQSPRLRTAVDGGGRQAPRDRGSARRALRRAAGSPVASIADTSMPIAQASGLPPNVLPCSPGGTRRAPRVGHDRRHRHDPAAERLAQDVDVGRTPSWSQAKVQPVRPRPDWISSAIISTLARASSRTARR